MTFARTMLFCVVATAAILVPASAIAARHPPVRPARSVGLPELDLQVLLDRAGFSPGEIDGAGGPNSEKALMAFLAARGHAPDVTNRKAWLEAFGVDSSEPTVSYTITAADAAGPFTGMIPEDMTEKSKLPGLYYTSVLEALGERFHASPGLLQRLNPGATFAGGDRIRVPNVVVDQSAPQGAGQAARVVVSKSASVATVYDQSGKVIFHAPVTSGSEHDSLPLGKWMVTSVVRNPTFNYNPDLFWDAEPGNAKATIPAGPNNPVGVVWIDIDKPHYGLHGTPEPGRIGVTTSHGCVRLTNWDAARLAGLVTKGTSVVFEE